MCLLNQNARLDYFKNRIKYSIFKIRIKNLVKHYQETISLITKTNDLFQNTILLYFAFVFFGYISMVTSMYGCFKALYSGVNSWTTYRYIILHFLFIVLGTFEVIFTVVGPDNYLTYNKVTRNILHNFLCLEAKISNNRKTLNYSVRTNFQKMCARNSACVHSWTHIF